MVQLHHGDFPVRLLLPHFGLAEDEIKILNGFPIQKINIHHSLEKEDITGRESDVLEEWDTTESSECSNIQEDNSASQKKGEEPLKKEKRKPKNFNRPLTREEKRLRQVNRITEENRALELLKKASFDCLIIASKFRAKTVVQRLIKFLAPSRPVVVFSPYKEVLTECLHALKESRSVINLDLKETWWRTYQVLAMRTHPQIMMDGTGGYLLTGIKVDNGLQDSTDDPDVSRNPPVNPPVNPSNPNSCIQDETDAKLKPVIPAETSQIDSCSDVDVKPNVHEGNKSDADFTTKPDGDSMEPPLKRTKSN